eukprot:TRINITY_DN58329_c0_g1_i1.p1 TRINITY_DN58329_c0_g1~~TRINITY_DN58329_c0_g1_i1.p1  ORF type:complete len:412 (+),score=43.01 TRINITY_DN58329_c0_g1_i1:31-1266(+)
MAGKASVEFEFPFCKVPIETFVKSNRTVQKNLDKDYTVVNNAMNTLIDREKANPDVEKTCNSLDKIITKLRGVKRKLQEAEAESDTQLEHFHKRIEHLWQLLPADQPATEQAPTSSASSTSCAVVVGSEERISATVHQTRIQRQLVDYLLRRGYSKTADTLTKRYNLQALVDIAVFHSAQPIIDSLLRKHSCTEALQWCKENQVRLKKNKSMLEFHLRLQEFISMIQKKEKFKALEYCQKYLSGQAATQLGILKSSLSALVLYSFHPPQYQFLFDHQRWEDLVEEFKKELLVVSQLGPNIPLHMLLQSGMLALNAPQAYESGEFNPNDPMCSQEFQQLAEDLPKANRKNSTLVCRVSGEVMDGDNPPLVLPNGRVYSTQSLKKLRDVDGTVCCPATNDRYHWSQLHKVYVM